MNRYYYYLMITFMFINTILFVPKALLDDRYNGSFMSIAIAVVLGTTFVILGTKSFERFPQQGLPEILNTYLPGWIRVPLVFFFGVMWFIAGGIVLVIYSVIAKGFLNPDMRLLFVLVAFMFFAAWGATRQSETVLFLMEIILVLNVPFIVFILFKATFNPYVNWDAIRAMGAYALKPPTWQSLSAAVYVFTGYVNLAIFNRVFGSRFKAKYIWSVPILGAGVLANTFLIPIGFHGTEGVGDYIFTWISTADSMRMEFGFIERVIFLFLLLFLNLSLLFGIITWHVGTELIRSMLFVPKNKTFRSLLPWIICACFGVLFVIAGNILDEKQMIRLSLLWLLIRLPAEALLVFLLVFLARKVKRA